MKDWASEGVSYEDHFPGSHKHTVVNGHVFIQLLLKKNQLQIYFKKNRWAMYSTDALGGCVKHCLYCFEFSQLPVMEGKHHLYHAFCHNKQAH